MHAQSEAERILIALMLKIGRIIISNEDMDAADGLSFTIRPAALGISCQITKRPVAGELEPVPEPVVRTLMTQGTFEPDPGTPKWWDIAGRFRARDPWNGTTESGEVPHSRYCCTSMSNEPHEPLCNLGHGEL